VNEPSQPHERHNHVTRHFFKALESAGVIQDGIPGMMVIMESLMFSIMDINVKQFKLSPSKSAEMMELAYQRALEAFTKNTG
jgi:hypothetical protein